jgi:hypothetical protein
MAFVSLHVMGSSLALAADGCVMRGSKRFPKPHSSAVYCQQTGTLSFV